MQLVENNRALILRLKNPNPVLATIPKSKLLGEENGISQVLVKWGLEESQILSKLNIKNVPSPIRRDYKWTGFHKPMMHQIKTASFLTLNKKAFCFNEQGTGKTASCIWAADYLMNLGIIKRVLVICPLSIMDSAWRADLFTFAMHRTVDIAYGTPKKRKKIIEGDAEFVIVNYDGVEIVQKELQEADFDLIIVDEANAYKNNSTRRWKCLWNLVMPKTWLWMLTGTPAAQSPEDAFGLAKLVCPERVPKFRGAWKDQVMVKLSQFTWIPRKNSVQLVHAALQPAIRFTKEQCLDLPEMTYVTRIIPLTAQQSHYYKKIKTEMLVHTADEQITAVNAATVMNKLLQLSCGVVYSDSGEAIAFDGKNRLDVMLEVIRETTNKVLIFVPFRHAIEVVSETLTANKISNEVVSGAVSATKRADIFRRFQQEADPRVLVIQPQAVAHGVTLTAADTVIWFGPTMSLETYLQANARVHRQGQINKTTVVHLQGSSVEAQVYGALRRKEDIHSKVVELFYNEVDKVNNKTENGATHG
jgi:SNF2 family DNA or RNA helicase